MTDLSRCVRCGVCKAECPTYLSGLCESVGARGRMVLLHALKEKQLTPSPALNERIFSCILCRACSGRCPLGIDIPEEIYRGRALLRESDRKRRLLRMAAGIFMRWPEMSFSLLRLGQDTLLPFILRKRKIPFLPKLPAETLKWTRKVFRPAFRKGRVAFFPGCSVYFLMPGLAESSIRVLLALGYEVVIPHGIACCGAPYRALGLEEEAGLLAKQNAAVLSGVKADAVVSLCPTCTLTLKHEYPGLIGKGIDTATDISQFLHGKIGAGVQGDRKVFYHDPCHLRFGLKVTREPRDLIMKAGGILVGPDEGKCCGFGGTFCYSFAEMSEKLLSERAATILGSDPDAVVTSCPGCMFQLRRSVSDRPVIHTIEFIEQALLPPEEKKRSPGKRETGQ